MNTQHKVGLVVLGLISLGDLAAPLVADGDTPPGWVAVISAALGLASLACLPAAWVGRRSATLGLLGTRLVSVLLATPAFFVEDVPAVAVGMAGVTLAFTVVGVVLVLAGTRQVVAA